MSKIYNKYIELRNKSNSNTLYLFKYGIFLIVVDNDAKLISEYLHLKLTPLNNNIVKCGFPINSLSKYINLLKATPYNVEIVELDNDKTISTFDFLYYDSLKNIADELLKVNVETLSISQIYDFVLDIQHRLSAILKNINTTC